MPEATTHSLEKTREKLTRVLEVSPDAKRVRISAKLAKSINEHLWRLANLEK